MTISLMLPLVGKTQTDLKRVDKGTGPLSFTPATTATRLNPDTNLIESVASGDLREDGRQYLNRLYYSEDFSQANWAKSSVTVASDNAAAPNGKAVAQSLTAAAANGTCLQAVTDVSRVRYGSIYLKRKTGTGTIQVTLDGGSTWTTVAVTSEWVRLGATQPLANPSFGIRIVASGDAVYAWGAQLEDAAAATRYKKSGSSPAYSPQGVLIEGQRTNVVLWSEALDDAVWVKGNVTITANATTDPMGTTTADKIVETAVNNNHYVAQVCTKAASALDYVFSVYLKAAERTKARIQIEDGAGNGMYALVDLSVGTIEAATLLGTGFTTLTDGIDIAPNGYYRAWIHAVTNTATSINSFVYLRDDTGASSYLGDVTKGLYAFGHQLEQAAFPSSYIPTTSAAVTRNADTLSVPSSGNMVTLSPFTIVSTVDVLGNLNGNQQVVGSDVNYAGYALIQTNGIRSSLYNNAGDALGLVMEVPAEYGQSIKRGWRFDGTNQDVFRKGVNGTAGGRGTPVTEISTVYIGSHAAIQHLYGHIKNLMIFNRALTDAEMIAITG